MRGIYFLFLIVILFGCKTHYSPFELTHEDFFFKTDAADLLGRTFEEVYNLKVVGHEDVATVYSPDSIVMASKNYDSLKEKSRLIFYFKDNRMCELEGRIIRDMEKTYYREHIDGTKTVKRYERYKVRKTNH